MNEDGLLFGYVIQQNKCSLFVNQTDNFILRSPGPRSRRDAHKYFRDNMIGNVLYPCGH